MKYFLLVIFITQVITACTNRGAVKENVTAQVGNSKDACCKTTSLSCKLTTPQLQQRKATVLASLRKQIRETKDLPNGFAFRFSGTDKMIDELAEFAKTERECCDFFTFAISIAGDKSNVWLELTGPKGAKDFIKTEMEL